MSRNDIQNEKDEPSLNRLYGAPTFTLILKYEKYNPKKPIGVADYTRSAKGANMTKFKSP